MSTSNNPHMHDPAAGTWLEPIDSYDYRECAECEGQGCDDCDEMGKVLADRQPAAPTLHGVF